MVKQSYSAFLALATCDLLGQGLIVRRFVIHFLDHQVLLKFLLDAELNARLLSLHVQLWQQCLMCSIRVPLGVLDDDASFEGGHDGVTHHTLSVERF
jgi:hypothetical protein